MGCVSVMLILVIDVILKTSRSLNKFGYNNFSHVAVFLMCNGCM
jgi:hypothetical protein